MSLNKGMNNLEMQLTIKKGIYVIWNFCILLISLAHILFKWRRVHFLQQISQQVDSSNWNNEHDMSETL